MYVFFIEDVNFCVFVEKWKYIKNETFKDKNSEKKYGDWKKGEALRSVWNYQNNPLKSAIFRKWKVI